MSTTSRREKPFTANFVEVGAKLLLELMNTTEQQLRGVEILTIFLKDDETPGGGPSRAHITFEDIKCIQPKEKVVVSHRTWIDGKSADSFHDMLERLTIRADGVRFYVLDISWTDMEGKSQYQSIPVGH